MSKFDRCIFISIAIGIWTLAMTQVFKPLSVSAVAYLSYTDADPCVIRTKKMNEKFREEWKHLALPSTWPLAVTDREDVAKLEFLVSKF